MDDVTRQDVRWPRHEVGEQRVLVLRRRHVVLGFLVSHGLPLLGEFAEDAALGVIVLREETNEFGDVNEHIIVSFEHKTSFGTIVIHPLED